MSDLSDYDELTWVATIVGAHGIKGAVKAKYFSDAPEYYLKVKIFSSLTTKNSEKFEVKKSPIFFKILCLL